MAHLPPYMTVGLAKSPRIFRRLALSIGDARMDARPDPDRFTPREVFAHLADWEPILRDRIVTAAESSGAGVQAYDEGELAVQGRYDIALVEKSLDLFERERGATVRLLEGLSESQLAGHVLHPERGRLSLLDVATMLLGHDLYHVEQLCEMLGERTAGTW